jgi:CheY-specific phosphatase CheX
LRRDSRDPATGATKPLDGVETRLFGDILIADSDDACARVLLDTFEAAGISCRSLPLPQLETSAEKPGVSLVIRNGHVLPAARKALTSVFDAPPFRMSPLSLARYAAQRLAAHEYTDTLLQAIHDNIAGVFRGSSVLATPEHAYLRIGRSLHAEPPLVVSIRGRLRGHLSLSGSPHVFARVVKQWLTRDTPDLARDCTAEITNILAAQIRNHYLAQGMESTQTPPRVSPVQLELVEMTPKLVIPFRFGAGGHLLLELLLTTVAGESRSSGGGAAPGSITLF